MKNELEVSQYDELIDLAEKRQERISSTTDITINRKLFGILKKAAAALKGVEERTVTIGEMEKELKERQDDYFPIMAAVIITFIISVIISLGFAYSANLGNASAKKILEYVIENSTSEDHRAKAQKVLDKRPYTDYSHSASYGGGDDLIQIYKKEVVPIQCFIGSFKGWLIIWIVMAVLLFVTANWIIREWKKKYIPEQKRKIEDATMELQAFINENEMLLRLVPSACKSSKHLYRVVTLYENGKADNLKESLNLADTGEYRDYMVMNMNQMSQTMAAVLGQLNNIVGYMEDSHWY